MPPTPFDNELQVTFSRLRPYTTADLLAPYMNCMSLPQNAPHNHPTHQTRSALVSLLYCPIAASIAELASAVPASGGGKCCSK